jgi:hypothetical protein
MLRKAETFPIYKYDREQIATLRKAHVENMQEILVPGKPPIEIAKGLGGVQTSYITIWKTKDVEWKDVLKFLKVKLFKLFNIKSSLDKLFIKKKKEDSDFDEWFEKVFK